MTNKALLVALIFAGAILLYVLHCPRCDDRGLHDFEKKDVMAQIHAYSRACETHCPLEGSIPVYLEMIADHGSASVSAVAPYLDRSESGFNRQDAIIVLQDAADNGTDISSTIAKLRMIAATGQDEYDRQFAALALAAAARRANPHRKPPTGPRTSR